ncbi:hypothetical protein TSO352_05160 [Azospirillum sp. TSO35-2]|nr:hypothetical protein TSO352_05160 [Azospirillum sp. TSO35-2]
MGAWRARAGLRPERSALRCNLGAALQEAGRLAEAVAAYDAALRLDPGLSEAHVNRGNALRDQGDRPAAERAYRAALAANPAATAAARGLGRLRLASDPLAAARALRIAARLADGRTAADWSDVAAALTLAGRPAEALAVLDAAAPDEDRTPLPAGGHNVRALALRALGRGGEGDAALRRALATDPALAEGWVNRAQGLIDQGRPGLAAVAARRALRLRPAYPAALGVLAQSRHDSGRPEEAVALMRRAMAVEPQLDRTLHGNALLYRQSDPDAGPAALLAEHRRWERLHAPRSAVRLPPGPERGEVLRIGYLSADVCAHSVASFFEPLLAAHDRRAVRVTVYAAVRRPDAVTERLRGLADDWRDVAALDDAALAALVRADRIDALIELGGHTGNSRLAALADAPAPVRLTALGYPGTSGLALEGRLTDPIIEPPAAQAWSSEPLVPLPDGFLCYRPPDAAPEPRRVRDDGPILFGSFNVLGKLTPAVLALWAEILAALPDSRLMLKSRGLGDPAVVDELRARFAGHGIAADRLDLVGWSASRAAHLALYDRIDIALDPFPYNGTTTTCEALWMGVPVVTLAGERHAGRVGMALLTRAGLPDLIAPDPAAYRRIALTLAADPGRRAALRTELRPRLRTGPLGNAAALATAVEDACRRLLRERAAAEAPPTAG